MKIRNLNIIFAIGILIIVSLSWVIPIAFASETDWTIPENFPLTLDEWGAPEEVFAQDDSYSTSDYDARQNEETWYEFQFSVFGLSGCPVIDGIEVRFDAYGSGSGITYDIKLTWNLGTSWTSVKTSSVIGTSDTDTYIYVGGSTDTWGRTWAKEEFAPDTFGIYFKQNGVLHQFAYCDHIQVKVYYTYETPFRPDNLQVINKINYCNQSHWAWIKGSGADYTMWRISDVGYPTMTTGIEIYNDTDNDFVLDYDVKGLLYNRQYYICGFSWNTTYCCWGENELDWFFSTPCNHKINNIYNNTAYTNNGYEYYYNPSTGYTWYLNFTGNITQCNSTNITLYENIYHTKGTHEYTYNSSTGFKVWANYSTGILLYQLLNNVTGTHSYIWNNQYGLFRVYANYTGNETGGNCELIHFDYSDENITINITYYGCNTTNTSTYKINETNWLNLLSAISFESSQLFLIILLSLWIYFVEKYYKTKDAVFVYIQLGLVIPLTILISIIALDFIFGYIVVFVLPSISSYLFVDKIERDKKMKEFLEERGYTK